MIPFSTRSLTLRSRFLLVVSLGVVLPLAVTGAWLTGTTRASGEELLRTRLEESLGEVVQAVGHRWVRIRGELLTMAEDPAVRSALLREASPAAGDGSPVVEPLEGHWSALEEVVERAALRDEHGRLRGTMDQGGDAGGVGRGGWALVPVTLPVHDPLTSQRLGSVELELRLDALLPGGLWWPGVGGSVLAVFEPNGGAPLLPLPMESTLFARDRFEWGEDTWLAVRHRLHDPPLLLAMAAPTEAFTEPFARAARRGLWAFVAVLAASTVLALVLTSRMAAPLEHVAEAADAVSQGDIARQVAEDGPDEIRRVGRAFNAMTESLRRTLRELSQREAVAAVGEFAASLAHEVRNPLTSIRLDLERARERAEDEPSRGLLERALGEIERLDAAVSGSLRVARSGRLTLEPVDLRRPLEAAVHAAAPVFAERGVTLEPVTPPSGQLTVQGNAGALEQLLLNLLRNAAEALEPGGWARIDIEEGDPTHLRVVVRDDGPGISDEAVDRVFEPFFSTKEEGTGLGLPIARRIAQAHGGDLIIESTPGEGTAVHVVLPRDGGRRAMP